jgi:hypothetical protein
LCTLKDGLPPLPSPWQYYRLVDVKIQNVGPKTESSQPYASPQHHQFCHHNFDVTHLARCTSVQGVWHR